MTNRLEQGSTCFVVEDAFDLPDGQVCLTFAVPESMLIKTATSVALPGWEEGASIRILRPNVAGLHAKVTGIQFFPNCFEAASRNVAIRVRFSTPQRESLHGARVDLSTEGDRS